MNSLHLKLERLCVGWQYGIPWTALAESQATLSLVSRLVAVPVSRNILTPPPHTDGRTDRQLSVCWAGEYSALPESSSYPDVVCNGLQIYIDVADINDNDPYFLPDTRMIQLSELSAPGTAVLLPATHDADTTANSVTSYQLSAVEVAEDGVGDQMATDLFSLTMSTKLDGTTDVKLMLVRELDREDSDTHRLVVTAFDGGQPRRSGTLNLIVKVLDANDNRFAVRKKNMHHRHHYHHHHHPIENLQIFRNFKHLHKIWILDSRWLTGNVFLRQLTLPTKFNMAAGCHFKNHLGE